MYEFFCLVLAAKSRANWRCVGTDGSCTNTPNVAAQRAAAIRTHVDDLLTCVNDIMFMVTENDPYC
jgi:hypothetical protein